MKIKNSLIFSTSSQTQPAGKLRKTINLAHRHRRLYGKPQRNNTGKESDSETGLYYYGARYLDPKTSRWISGDPAVGEYIPSAPVSEEAKKRNGNLPGMGGVFNYVNLHVYHYAGNNPVKYVDPNGKTLQYDENTDPQKVEAAINAYSYYQFRFNDQGILEETDQINLIGSRIYSSAIYTLINCNETIKIGFYDDSNISKDTNPRQGDDITLLPFNRGSDFRIYVYSNNNQTITMVDGNEPIAPVERKLMHEIAGHAAPFVRQQQNNAVNIENAIMVEMFQKIILYSQNSIGTQNFYNEYVLRMYEDHPSFIPERYR